MLRGFSVPLTPHAAGDLSAALASALGRLASALRTLRPPQAIPALRPVQPASRGTPLAAITEGLVEATDTLDSVLRKTSRSSRPRPRRFGAAHAAQRRARTRLPRLCLGGQLQGPFPCWRPAIEMNLRSIVSLENDRCGAVVGTGSARRDTRDCRRQEGDPPHVECALTPVSSLSRMVTTADRTASITLRRHESPRHTRRETAPSRIPCPAM